MPFGPTLRPRSGGRFRRGRRPRTELGHGSSGIGDRAEAERRAHLLGDAGEHADVGERVLVLDDRVERTDATLPVDEHAGLLDDRRNRQHDVGDAGDVALANFEADDEVAAFSAARAAVGIGQVVDLDTADDQSLQGASRHGLEDRRRVATLLGDDRPDAPCCGEIGAGLGDVERTSTRQQRRQAAGLERASFTGATRDPRDARLRRGRQRSAALKPPCTVASRSPTRITALRSSSSSASAAASWPGSRTDQFAGHLGQAASRCDWRSRRP